MKQGMGLEQTMSEVERVARSARDFRVPVSRMEVRDGNGHGMVLAVRGLSLDPLTMNKTAQEQLRDFTGIPKAVWDHLQANDRERLVGHANHQLRKKDGEGRLLRTLDGNARAVLSQSYRPLENLDYLRAALPVLRDRGVEVRSATVTEDRLYLKGVVPSLRADLSGLRPHVRLLPGRENTLLWGVSMSNSEVGKGSMLMEEFYEWLVCLNGARGQAVVRRAHLGRRSDVGDEALEVLSDETRTLEDAAVFSRTRDLMSNLLTQDSLDRHVEKLRAAAARPAGVNLVETVAVVGEKLGLTNDDITEVTNLYAQAGDFTAFGLSNAMTAYAQAEALTYERSHEFERIGGQIVELSKADWEKLIAPPKRGRTTVAGALAV